MVFSADKIVCISSGFTVRAVTVAGKNCLVRPGLGLNQGLKNRYWIVESQEIFPNLHYSFMLQLFLMPIMYELPKTVFANLYIKQASS